MKKTMLAIFTVVLLASLAMAQTFSGYTSGTGITAAVDILGAHNNYGRGCAGCHAPHSGARGSGGNNATGSAITPTDPLTGSNALFAQDMSPLFASTFAPAFGDTGGYVLNPSADGVTNTGTVYTQLGEVRGILMCLACHDGNVAKGGMMQGKLWEASLLPAGVYGPNAANIPTLLGADGATGLTGNNAYNNDHPVGRAANWGRLGLSNYFTAATVSATGKVTLGSASGQYATFATNYGYPAIQGSAWSVGMAVPDGDTVVGDIFVTCTTCHNQHSMYVYTTPKTNGGLVAGTVYPTYFFINSPYNPGASVSAASGKASSATQFCRQCHFGESNEAAGVTGVTTQF